MADLPLLWLAITMPTASSQFEDLLSRYFKTLLAENPVYAAYCGLESGRGRFGRATLDFEKRWHGIRKQALARLDSFSPRELTNEQQLDRLAFRSLLLRECEDFERGRHALDPNALDQALNILLHELQRGSDEPSRVSRNLRSLLKAIAAIPGGNQPRSLTVLNGCGAKSWSKPPQERHRCLKQWQHFSNKPARNLRMRNIFPPRKKPLAIIAIKFSPGLWRRIGAFAVGAAVLQRRVRDQLGLDYSLGEIEALALSEIKRVGAELRLACRKFGAGKSTDAIINRARSTWDPGKDLLGVYQRETRRVADAFRSAKAVTFPKGETLEVRPVPEFMRHLFPTAAYSQPGAFEKRQRGVFWVNDLSVTKRSEPEKLAERQQHFGLALTCAHEAYPGHHLQFTTANQHPRKWRRLFAHSVFYEGWTLWCEQMMVDLNIDRSPWLRVQQLHDALWRCHRILVDLRLHTGRYSYEQAVAHMQRNLGFTRARAEADVNWYTASPTVPMSYWLGRLENERLRRRLMDGRGWSLRKFNDWLISFGTLPQAWIEKYGLD